MKNELSVLIPCYNSKCVKLVVSLVLLLEKEQDRGGLANFEILVGDDGSTDTRVLEYNKEIESFVNSRYIIRGKNCGRAAIRNFLAKEAQYKWLLYIDCDMVVDNGMFIRNYLHAKGDVVVGGIKIGGDAKQLRNNIRYKYEKACEPAHSAQLRNSYAHKEFRTTNFLINKDVMLAYPFDEDFRNYGYEDVMMGKTLKENDISIIHIDNPVILDDYEDNPTFIAKTEEALRTLHQFRKQLQDYSTLLKNVERINSYCLTTPVKITGKLLKGIIRKNLTGNKPALFLFNIYKLLYYISL